MADLAEQSGLTVVAGLEDERAGRVPSLPARMCPRRGELATEPLRWVGVANLLAGGHAGPLDVETDMPIRGRREMEQPVGYRAVIRNCQVVHTEAGRASACFDVCCAVRNGDCPEEAAGAESRIEVVQLIRKVRGSLPLEDVESDEAERCVLVATGEVDVLALHDPHVDVERLVAELALTCADRMGRSHSAVEVEDRGGVAAAEEVEMEVSPEDIGRTLDRLRSSWGAASRSQQRDAGGSQRGAADAGRGASDECPPGESALPEMPMAERCRRLQREARHVEILNAHRPPLHSQPRLRRTAVYSLIGRLSTQICRLSCCEHPTDVGVRTVVDLNELIDQRHGQLLAMFAPVGE